MVTSTMYDNGVCEAFKAAIVTVKTSALMVQAITKAAIVDEKIMKAVVQLVAIQGKREFKEVASSTVNIAPSTPSSSPGHSPP